MKGEINGAFLGGIGGAVVARMMNEFVHVFAKHLVNFKAEQARASRVNKGAITGQINAVNAFSTGFEEAFDFGGEASLFFFRAAAAFHLAAGHPIRKNQKSGGE